MSNSPVWLLVCSMQTKHLCIAGCTLAKNVFNQNSQIHGVLSNLHCAKVLRISCNMNYLQYKLSKTIFSILLASALCAMLIIIQTCYANLSYSCITQCLLLQNYSIRHWWCHQKGRRALTNRRRHAGASFHTR